MKEYRYERTQGGVGGLWLVTEYMESDNHKQLLEEYINTKDELGFKAGAAPISGSRYVAIFYTQHEAKQYCDFKNGLITGY